MLLLMREKIGLKCSPEIQKVVKEYDLILYPHPHEPPELTISSHYTFTNYSSITLPVLLFIEMLSITFQGSRPLLPNVDSLPDSPDDVSQSPSTQKVNSP